MIEMIAKFYLNCSQKSFKCALSSNVDNLLLIDNFFVELAEYQRKRRKEFEDNIRKNRAQIANWVKYAKWEESVGEMQRARSVFERSLDVDHRSITLWLQYAEMEMR